MLSISGGRDPWGTHFGSVGSKSQPSSTWSANHSIPVAASPLPRPVGPATTETSAEHPAPSDNTWQLFSNNTSFAPNIADEFIGGSSFGSGISDAASLASSSMFSGDAEEGSSANPLRDLCNSATEQTSRETFPTIATLSISAQTFMPTPKASPWAAKPAPTALHGSMSQPPQPQPHLPRQPLQQLQEHSAGITSRQKPRSSVRTASRFVLQTSPSSPEGTTELNIGGIGSATDFMAMLPPSARLPNLDLFSSKENSEPVTRLQWGTQPVVKPPLQPFLLQPPPMLQPQHMEAPRRHSQHGNPKSTARGDRRRGSNETKNKKAEKTPNKLSSSTPASSTKSSKECKVCLVDLPKSAFVGKQWLKGRSCCMSCAESKSDAAELYFIEASVRGQMLRNEIPSIWCVRCRSDKPGTAFPDGLFTFAAAYQEGKQITQHNQGNPLLNAICLRCSGQKCRGRGGN